MSSFGGIYPSPPGSDEYKLPNGEPYHWEPFRAGAPGPLPWLPVLNFPVERGEPIVEEFEKVRPIIHRHLQEHRIEWSDITVLHRRPDDDINYRTKFGSDLTLLVTAKFRFDNTWRDAINDIRETLRRNYVAELKVEFLDGKALKPQPIFPIDASDPIVPAWEQIRPEIHGALVKCPWTCIDVVRKGKETAAGFQSPITIIVTVPVDNYNLYLDEHEKLKAVCTNHGFPEVDVQIRHSPGPLWADTAISTTASPTAATAKPELTAQGLPDGSYNKLVKMGVSMGPSGSFEYPNGTFGGYLELLDPNSGISRGIYGLTCYHVIEPAIPAERQEFYRKKGIMPKDTITQNLTMTQPGHKDHLRNVLDLERRLVASNHPKVRSERESVEAAWHNHGKLGTVLCGSGLRRLIRDHRLDWALIKVYRERIGDNLLPDSREDWPGGSMGDRIIHEEIRESLAGKHLDAIGKLLNEDVVYKKGKSTGCRIGRFSHIKSDVRVDDEDFISTEYVFIGTEKDKSFSQGGDSGSMVFSLSGAWLGIVWGGNPFAGLTGNSYVTDSQRLVEDIERSTGCRVRMPLQRSIDDPSTA
ncbi:hypothetical protein L228DRAFT_177867 [Xylona heveae TC161]|uniref:Peptidase S64 n=1 Tax=Xylona heveae (strain CBS 132557 / TC161) TaxID=1328760 RepID=A0A165F8V9_XYLHT|nr:hypothetical protein L228DRAFT_177867 [Xylona heveae TC161]KZF20715.1 hypothetical protein L228DRAFT_177867 [Xylona heveae TC161]